MEHGRDHRGVERLPGLENHIPVQELSPERLSTPRDARVTCSDRRSTKGCITLSQVAMEVKDPVALVVDPVVIAAYQTDGFAVARNLFTIEECEFIADYFTKMVERGGD